MRRVTDPAFWGHSVFRPIGAWDDAPVTLHSWPIEFHARKRGEGCPQCAEGRAAETEHGVRYFKGIVADGYLQWRGPTRGYSVVVFRARHVCDPQSMSSEEHAAFWSEVSSVARALEHVYGPIHLNFQILGNQDPHVHVHIVPRYDPDPAPSRPLPTAAWEASRNLGDDEMHEAVAALRSALSQDR